MEATSTTTAVRTRSTLLDLPAIAAFGVPAVLVGWVAADDGGWWPETWAWTAFATLAVALVVALVRDHGLGRLDLAFLGGLIAFGGWTAASALWSQSVPSTVDEAYRVLAYVGAALLCMLVIERRTVPHAVGGVLTAIAVLGTYALATRLLPDRIGEFSSSAGDYRLSEPVTYWNGLGLFLVVGIVLALGFTARGAALWTRALAAAALPVLASAVYFTFSRGAWVALGVGMVAALAVDPRRLQLLASWLAVAPFSLAAVWLASGADGLTVVDSTLAQAAHDGHSLILPIVALASGSALVAVGIAAAERGLDIGRTARVTFASALVVAIVALGSAAFFTWGSPVAIADRAWDDFRSPSNTTDGDLGRRLLDLSATGRIEHWRVAWDEAKANPVIGSSAGTYWQVWAENRPSGVDVRDAHSLYLETLAELGLVGLALLGLSLLVPIVGGVRARMTPIVSAGLGGNVAWLAHTAIDWDWELIGVTLAPLVVGVALIAAARPVHAIAAAHGWLLPAAAAMLTVPALAGVLAYAPLGSAREALDQLHLDEAAEDARAARRAAPWASAPWEILGDVAAQQGQLSEARRAYREAVQRDGSSWELWYALAAISTGNEQRVALARAIELNPSSPAVRELREATLASNSES
jgi:tetratricopeptide (TPR) repeat protein